MDLGYIDPGSGSMILQMILGGLAAAAVFLKMFWHRVLVFLHLRKPDEASRREEPSDVAPASERGSLERPVSRPGSADPAAARTAAPLDPGSFRDRDSRVFYEDGRRAPRALARTAWTTGSRSRGRELFAEAVAEGKVVATDTEIDGVEHARTGSSPGPPRCLEHERIPFVSYPYEWPFSMLRDAALLQLELLRRALDEDLTLKDASPTTSSGAGPGRSSSTSAPSSGCPRASRGRATASSACSSSIRSSSRRTRASPSSPGSAGALTASRPQECAGCMSFRDLFRRGVMTHVALHARLERRHAESTRDVKARARRAGFRRS